MTPTVDDPVRAACDELAACDSDLAALIAAIGYPPIETRATGFPTLLLLILEQQVSIASAQATYRRVEERLGAIEPTALLTLDPHELRSLGLSRQKARYGLALADAVVTGALDLDALTHLPDETARARLIAVPGIGPWTADVYLLMALARPDVWPSGDIALQAAAQRVKSLPRRPSGAELDVLAEPWRPYRSFAAHLLWHLYLTERRRAPR
jgi:DNA-3-methyladenine glycosylase II